LQRDHPRHVRCIYLRKGNSRESCTGQAAQGWALRQPDRRYDLCGLRAGSKWHDASSAARTNRAISASGHRSRSNIAWFIRATAAIRPGCSALDWRAISV